MWKVNIPVEDGIVDSHVNGPFMVLVCEEVISFSPKISYPDRIMVITNHQGHTTGTCADLAKHYNNCNCCIS